MREENREREYVIAKKNEEPNEYSIARGRVIIRKDMRIGKKDRKEVLKERDNEGKRH